MVSISSFLLAGVLAAGELQPIPAPRLELYPLPPPPKVEKPMESVKQTGPIKLMRLPGPRNWFHCPHCGRSDCLMFLGDHLRRVHQVDMDYLDRVGYQRLPILHDNLHNENWKPPQTTSTSRVQTAPVQTYSSGCSGPFCRLRRLFGR